MQLYTVLDNQYGMFIPSNQARGSSRNKRVSGRGGNKASDFHSNPAVKEPVNRKISQTLRVLILPEWDSLSMYRKILPFLVDTNGVPWVLLRSNTHKVRIPRRLLHRE